MAEIRVLPCKIEPDGARRLLSALEDTIASGRDPGPRGPQMRALAHSLKHASLELRREMERISLRLTEHPCRDGEHADVLRWRDELLNLADASAHLAAVAASYPS